jgi:hypothetical protein
MSIVVALDQLAAALSPYPWGYLLTVGDDQRTHTLAVPTDVRDDALWVRGGRSSLANAAARPSVTMLFPHPQPGGMSLIVDGTAMVDGEFVTITRQHAILHRPAIAAP